MLRAPRPRPQTWASHFEEVGFSIALPFHAVEWIWQWTSYYLGRWAFLEVLEYLGTLSVLVAVVSYFAASGDRQKQKHYQAWQVVNTAQGKGGSGGRIEALQELNHDHVPLVGLDVSGAFLMGIKLPDANLTRSVMESADLRHANLSNSEMSFADLSSANLRQATLRRMNLQYATFDDADLTRADLSGSDLTGASLSNTDLTGANLRDVIWKNLKSVEKANIESVRNAPQGFIAWAQANGAQATKEP
jgi:hypothetical protein